MDLAQFDMNALGNEGAWVDILSPTGEATDLKVKVRGAHSDAVRKASEDHTRRVAEAVKAAKGRDIDFEALEKLRDADLAAASTIDWAGFERDGKPLPCTPENVRALYTHPGFLWLSTQVYAKAQEPDVFLKVSATS